MESFRGVGISRVTLIAVIRIIYIFFCIFRSKEKKMTLLWCLWKVECNDFVPQRMLAENR